MVSSILLEVFYYVLHCICTMLAHLPKYERCGSKNVLMILHVYKEKCDRCTW